MDAKQPLRGSLLQAILHPLAVVPNNLKKITTAAPKNVEIARVGITRQRLLHKQGK